MKGNMLSDLLDDIGVHRSNSPNSDTDVVISKEFLCQFADALQYVLVRECKGGPGR